MKNDNFLSSKDMPWLADQSGVIGSGNETPGTAKKTTGYLKNILARLHFPRKKASVIPPAPPDPAVAIIKQIQDVQLRTLVKELHYLTPTSLKAMRNICQECFILPEDCPYYDYSIPDVNKAIRRIKADTVFTANPEVVINELAKVNEELARHLRDYFNLDDDEEIPGGMVSNRKRVDF